MTQQTIKQLIEWAKFNSKQCFMEGNYSWGLMLESISAALAEKQGVSKYCIPTCTTEDGGLVMRIGRDNLVSATNYLPHFYGTESNPIKVLNEIAFAESVASAMNEEDANDGSSLLTMAIDKAIIKAIENGCESVCSKSLDAALAAQREG